MNVSELFALTEWVQNEVQGAGIPQKYQALQTILQQHSLNQARQPFEAQKDALIEALRDVNLNGLSNHQLLFLEKIGIADSIGDKGVSNIEDILYKNVLDVATSAQKLQEITQNINEGISKMAQISTGLSGNTFEESYELEGDILLRVTFTGDASMSNIKDFKSWGNAWFDIGRGVAMAHDATPEDIRVIGASKGSIVIELAVIAAIATTTSTIILAALKVAEKVMDIRIKTEELRGLRVKNDIVLSLEKEAEEMKEKGIEDISSTLAKELSLTQGNNGDKIAALTKSVNKLVSFVEAGGEVDFIVPEKEDSEEQSENPEYEKLRTYSQEIRVLENTLKHIEGNNP